MKNMISRLLFATGLSLALGGCASVGKEAQIARKADEYLDNGTTGDPAVAVTLAKEFYRASAVEASRKEREMKSAVQEQRKMVPDLESWTAGNTPH
jgi:hypothetical protein